MRRLNSISLLTSVLLAFVSAAALAASQNHETQTMPMESVVGSECPSTKVRVEQVQPTKDPALQRVVVSIPRAAVAPRPNLKLYRVDAQAFAFEDYQEVRDLGDSDRRSFSFVVRESEQFQFKIGFDSVQ